jgi:membrane-associated phospholipid phosphatase
LVSALRALLITFVILGATATAHAEPLEWKWQRFQTWEYVATGTVTAGLFASYLLAPTTPRRHGPVLFDEPVRDALLPETDAAKSRATVVSNLTFWSLAAFPFFGDAVLGAAVGRKNTDVAAQMVLIDAEAMAFNGLLFKLLELSVARARPYVSECISGGGTIEDCNRTGGTTTSMPSGHVSTAVTGAALICTHHLRLDLFGSRAADITACGVAVAAAIASGVSRIASDNHYTTDVLAGAAIGVVSGWLLPTVLHYTRTVPIVPVATPTTLGVAWLGVLGDGPRNTHHVPSGAR